MIKKRFFMVVVSLTLGFLFFQIVKPAVTLGFIDSNGVEQVGPAQSGQDIAPSGGLVMCGRTGSAYAQATGCGFAQAITLINQIINYLIMIATPLAATAFAYAGWLYLSAGDNPGQVSKAKEIFRDVGIGFIIILSGWLLFTLIAKTFLDPAAKYGTYLTP